MSVPDLPKPSPIHAFLAELKRRNVYKVGAMYAVAGWLLVQVATQVFPFFDVPNVAVRLTVIAIAAGFPLALILSWIYELTPQGIVKTDEVAPDASVTAATGQKLNRAIIGVLSVAVLVLLAKILWPHLTDTPVSTAPAAQAAAGDKSIAVLPFENLSDDKANGYFADGIQDEVLTRLAKIGALKVISRTSTQQYAAKPGNLPEIARQLGVANILEGSVQKIGDAVHINVQLIRAASDDHLWAESYNRKLDDIFGVEGEVAQAIAERMNATLTGAEAQQVTAVPTRNTAAYDAYLRGTALYRKGFAAADFAASAGAFREAVQADPAFASAWAALARSDSVMVFFGMDTSGQLKAETEQAVETAERLQPDAFDTQMARAYYVYRVQQDYDEARRRLEALHQRWPNETEPLSVLSYILAREDRMEDSIASIRQALVLDPLNLQYQKLLAINLGDSRHFDEALQVIARVQQIMPGEAESLRFGARYQMAKGDLDQAAAMLGPPPQALGDAVDAQATLAALQRRYAAAIAWLKPLLDAEGAKADPLDELNARLDLADLQRLNGDNAAAMPNYRQAQTELQALLQQQPNSAPILQQLAQAEAGLGNHQRALQLLDQAATLRPETKDALFYRSLLGLRADVLARAGQKDAAIAAIQHLLASGAADFPLTPALLRLDPTWDALRQDPRFRQLAAGTALTGQAKNP